jgi:[ribosomal protein S18]-alanine N-acetyltransferase
MSDPTSAPAGPDPAGERHMPFEVIPMRRRHLRQVVRIDGQSEGDRWSPGLFLAELRRGDDGRCYRVAVASSRVASSRIVGFAGLLYAADDGHVTTVAVDQAWHRQGVATALLLALATDARGRGCTALTLEVRASNHAALALYRQFGFAPAGVRKGYYSDNGEDALVLWATGIDTPTYADRLVGLSARPGLWARPGLSATPASESMRSAS